MKKIVVTGPESTGKTTLAQELANHYQTVWVAEFARVYLNQLDRPYREDDLVEIAKGQLKYEDWMASRATNGLLVCDTDLINLKIWSEFKYSRCHPWILENLKARKYDLYLLTNIDLPWEPDPLREHPHRREELFNLHLGELKDRNASFETISGDPDTRLRTAITSVQQLLP